MIKYNTTLKGTADEGAIQLLINPKFTMIVVDPVSLIRNAPYSTSLFWNEANVRHDQ